MFHVTEMPKQLAIQPYLSWLLGTDITTLMYISSPTYQLRIMYLVLQANRQLSCAVVVCKQICALPT